MQDTGRKETRTQQVSVPSKFPSHDGTPGTPVMQDTGTLTARVDGLKIWFTGRLPFYYQKCVVITTPFVKRITNVVIRFVVNSGRKARPHVEIRGGAMRRFRLRQISLGGAIALIAMIALVMALIAQTWRVARYQAEIARLRKVINPILLPVLDKNPDFPDEISP
jgi:hypothetical protein